MAVACCNLVCNPLQQPTGPAQAALCRLGQGVSVHGSSDNPATAAGRGLAATSSPLLWSQSEVRVYAIGHSPRCCSAVSCSSCSCMQPCCLIACMAPQISWLDGLLLCSADGQADGWHVSLATPTGMLVPSMGSGEASHTLAHTQAVQIGAAGLSDA